MRRDFIDEFKDLHIKLLQDHLDESMAGITLSMFEVFNIFYVNIPDWILETNTLNSVGAYREQVEHLIEVMDESKFERDIEYLKVFLDLLQDWHIALYDKEVMSDEITA